MGRFPGFITGRLWLVAAATGIVFPLAARAGDYHEGSTLDCAECHVMHTYANQQGAQGGPVRKAAEVGPLLKKDVNELCLVCHDNSPRAPDVLGRNLGKYAGVVRQAGYLNRLGVDGLPGTGHTLGSVEFAPGSQPPWNAEVENGSGVGLTCINCHAPHGSEGGSSAYRNLRSDAGHNATGRGLVTYNKGSSANDLRRDVFERRPQGYDESDVDFNEPNRRDSAVARFCAGCHDNFHGTPGDPNTVGGALGAGGRYRGFIRHPASGVNLSLSSAGASLHAYNSHTNKVKVMSELGRWGPAGTDATPTCISCHKAHGNGNAFGLILRSGQGALTEEGDSQGKGVESLCTQCHDPSAFAD